MLTRRDFIRVSCGAAAGAVLAGLGLSISPRKAHAIVGVDDALLGVGVFGLAGLLGIALGYKTYTDIESGTADSVGRAFGAYLSDAVNEGAIVAAAGADAATVVGAGYSEAQLKEAYARGAWADGLAQSITSTGAGALDWLNARTADAALAWGAFKAWTGLLSPDYPTTFINGHSVGAISAVNWLTFVSAEAIASNIITSYSPPFEVKSVIAYYQPWASDRYNRVQISVFDTPITFVDSEPSSSSTGLFVWGSSSGLSYVYNNVKAYSWYGQYKYWSGYTNGNGGFSFTGSRAVTYPNIDTVSLTVINPAMDRAVDTPQSIDPASWGFGVPVIGTDAVINGDTLQNSGHMLAPGTVGELTSDGTLSLPWSDIVWGAGLGLGDASVRGIEGDISLPLGVPIPADIPVTVSIPLSDTAYGEKTMTLEDALSSGIDTSISRATDIPVTAEGTPFYPVNPPGTNGKPPSGFPSIPFEGFFPFNMLFSWLHWLNDNVK